MADMSLLRIGVNVDIQRTDGKHWFLILIGREKELFNLA